MSHLSSHDDIKLIQLKKSGQIKTEMWLNKPQVAGLLPAIA